MELDVNSNPTPMSCAVSNGVQVAKITFGAIAYVLVIVLYVFVHDIGVSFYKERMGGFTARGVAIGITAELMFGFFIFINVVVFVLPRMALKFATIALMVAIVLFYFLPENPVRAMAYSMLTGGMSVIALFTRSLVHRLIVRRWLRASAVTSLNS